MSYSFKKLTPSDIAIFKNLLTVFGKAFNEMSTYQDAVPSDEYLHKLLSKPHFISLVATDDTTNHVVGGLAAYELDKFEQERSEIYIYDLAVDENYRRKGVATGLINELRKIASERKSYVIFVQADHGDEEAISLYNKLGIKEDVFHFDIKPFLK